MNFTRRKKHGKLYFKKSVSRNFINLATAQSTVCGNYGNLLGQAKKSKMRKIE